MSVARATYHEHQQTPSYLPSYTRLGHAIPGSKTVNAERSEGKCTSKCAGKSSVTRTSTRGNTLLPSTLTLLIGQRVSHSGGCVYVCSARAPYTTYTSY